ncbi:MAG TPA: hypothetical protein VHP83_13090 [Aggregatilineaceae bacterium]|nr:hypothetical protein [Aggregatilineaceae bacterium]
MRLLRWMLAAVFLVSAGPAGPRQPDYLPLIGTPQFLARFWHSQGEDVYGCALVAQASVLEALGYDFAAELDAMRELGQRDGWYDPNVGTIGLGQPLRAHDIPFDVFGTSLAAGLTPERALYELKRQLSAGRYAIVNLDAQQLAYYFGSAVRFHTVWVTGIRQDQNGNVISIITNDSLRGPLIEYPVAEFLAAWASQFNYYANFVHLR